MAALRDAADGGRAPALVPRTGGESQKWSHRMRRAHPPLATPTVRRRRQRGDAICTWYLDIRLARSDQLHQFGITWLQRTELCRDAAIMVTRHRHGRCRDEILDCGDHRQACGQLRVPVAACDAFGGRAESLAADRRVIGATDGRLSRMPRTPASGVEVRARSSPTAIDAIRGAAPPHRQSTWQIPPGETSHPALAS
jgi:hypothetical protein